MPVYIFMVVSTIVYNKLRHQLNSKTNTPTDRADTVFTSCFRFMHFVWLKLYYTFIFLTVCEEWINKAFVTL
jgi:hypothetical protein